MTAGHGHNHNHGHPGPRGNRGHRGNRGRGGAILGGGRRGTVVHYRYVTRKVWVPERHTRVLIPARYEMRWDPYCRQYVRVCVREAYYETRCEPGYWDYRQVRVPCHTDRPIRRGGRGASIRFRF